jgi:hypothetical protein
MAAIFVLFKGALTGPSPVDRARTGSKHHLITDSHGIPLAISLTGGNRNDVTQLCRWSMASAQSLGEPVDPASEPTGFSLTVAMTTTSTAGNCAHEA